MSITTHTTHPVIYGLAGKLPAGAQIHLDGRVTVDRNGNNPCASAHVSADAYRLWTPTGNGVANLAVPFSALPAHVREQLADQYPNWERPELLR